MLTIIKAWGQITGAEMILSGAVICVIIFTVVFLLFRANRNKKAIAYYLTAVFIVLEVCDILWLLYLFPQGAYFNRGLAGGSVFLLFPLFLLILICGLTVINRRKISRQ